MDDIRSEIHSLKSFSVVHVKRKANSVTHVLAKKAVFYVRDSIWSEETPPPKKIMFLSLSFSKTSLVILCELLEYCYKPNFYFIIISPY
jgi:hypothetical protein